MKASIKSIDLGSMADIEEFIPQNPSCFSLWLNFVIGLEGGSAGDLFRINVCTPSWLQATIAEPIWGRHLLIVDKYDLAQIKEAVERRLQGVDGFDWNAVAGKVARLMEWEFEDYV